MKISIILKLSSLNINILIPIFVFTMKLLTLSCKNPSLIITLRILNNTVEEEEEQHQCGSGSETDNGEMLERCKKNQTNLNSDSEPYVGMEFESEESAKVFYDLYATRLGFVMRVDAFRRSMKDGKIVWRRLVCNKEGFRKCRARQSENRKPRAVTREGCKALIVVKKDLTGKWVVTRFVKDHNHQLVVGPVNNRRPVMLFQTPDDKDTKIRELTSELQRERKRSAALQEQLNSVLKDVEEHSNHLTRNIFGIVQTVKEIESNRFVIPHK